MITAIKELSIGIDIKTIAVYRYKQILNTH